ncbi:hypothetical protein WME89_13025 [Sorangium sp. So ce321]|uniref:hypothetical protein n=1 Tax=Sorangium sp. So ce321 TaxID=3133300 RepID=UPI003F632619
MERWSPPVELSRQEQALMKRLTRLRVRLGFSGSTGTSCSARRAGGAMSSTRVQRPSASRPMSVAGVC